MASGQMTITNIASGAQFVINSFDLQTAEDFNGAGFDGIYLEAPTVVACGGPSATAPANPQASVTATGDSQTFTVYGNGGQQVTLAATGNGASTSNIRLGTGDLSLASGSVTLDIPQGQDSVTVTLVDPNASQQAQTINLTATQGENSTPSNTLAVTFNGTTANTSAPVVIPAEVGMSLPNSALPSDGATTGNLYAMGPLSAPAPLYNQNYLVTTGSGLNEVEFPSQGLNYVDGGVLTGTATDTITGGGGQDVFMLYQAISPTQNSMQNNMQVYAGSSAVSLSTALAQAQSATASNTKGDFFDVNGGNNTIVGGNGNDGIVTGQGNNTIVCGAGANTIWCGELYSQVGVNWNFQINPGTTDANGVLPIDSLNNSSTGGVIMQGATTLASGLYVGPGNNTIYGGTGDSYYSLSNGNNYLDAGGGNDYIWAAAGNNTIFGGAGNDTIEGGGTNYIDAEGGSDLIVAEGGNSTIYGGTGNDTIWSGDSLTDWATSDPTESNYLEAGSGNDVLHGAGGNDTLIGGSGNDSIYAGDGNAYIDAGDGNNTIYGGAGTETIVCGDGNDSINAGSGDVTITGGGGADTIFGGAGNDSISAGDGGTNAQTTQITAGTGNTTIVGGDGVDLITGGSGTNILSAGDGGDAGQASQVVAGSGATTITGGSGIDKLFGGSGDDLIYAGDGGTADNATSVKGGSGNSTLVAGAGYDAFSGSSGQTTYQINSDCGTVNIYYSAAGDTLQFGPGITIADISASTVNSTNGTQVTLTLNGGGSVTIDGGGLTQATFSDGTSASFAQLLSSQFVTNNTTYSSVSNSAATANLTLTGTANLVGTGSNVNGVISANLGNDTLIAGTANNTLIGGGGMESYVVGAGAGTVTTIQNSTENDVLNFGSGISLSNLSVSTSDDANGNLDVAIQVAGAGQVAIDGNLNSTASGGDGSNIMVDTLGFADGSTASLGALVAQLTSGPTAAASSSNVTLAGSIQNLTLTGSANISATGNDLANVMTAGAGNDTLIAGTGSDTLVGSSGNTTYVFDAHDGNVVINNSGSGDTLSFDSNISENELAASSTVVGGVTVMTITDNLNGSTITINGSGLNQFNFVDGNTATLADLLAPSYSNGTTTYSNISNTAASGITTLDMTGTADVTATANSTNDILIGNAGNDTLVAGTGNDTLFGGGASDDYVIANGGQTTTINQSGISDSLTFGTGVAFSDLSATAATASDGSTVVTLQNDQGGTLVINGYTNGESVDQINFADGSTGSLGALLAQATTGITAATSATDVMLAEGIQNMTLTGTANVSATGNDEDDVITTNSGNDTLVAGIADDTFVGGSGATTYQINAGSGNVTINNSNSADTLVLGAGITQSDLVGSSAVVNGVTVVTIVDDQGGTITVNGGGLANVSFADGSTSTFSQMLAPQYIEGTTLYSSISAVAPTGIITVDLTGSASISATANSANDVLRSNSGNDTLVTGAGDDTLIGGTGNTTYAISTNTNNTTIEQAGLGDVINLVGVGYNSSYTYASAATATDGSTTLTLNYSGGHITINDYVAGESDQINFGDGTTASLGALLAQQTASITATTAATSVTLAGGMQNMSLTGGADATIAGNSIDDVITGNSGNDTLIAGSASDTLAAGTGNDTLIAGTGNDVFAIKNASNTVTIEGSTATDVINYNVVPTEVTASSTTSNGVTTVTLRQGNQQVVIADGQGVVNFTGYGTETLNQLLGVAPATVYSSTGGVLGAGVTNLTLTGNANLSVTGNNLNDLITANSGNDTLSASNGTPPLQGANGLTTLVGGSGNDTFVITATYGGFNEVPNDVISEAPNSGSNTEETYTGGGLAQNVQNLTGLGSMNLNLIGNGLANVITANSGNDTLTAGGGVATLIGGVGNDTFKINSASDVVEANAKGNSMELSSVSAVAGTNVNLFAGTGNGNLTLTGNSTNCEVESNSGQDTLIAGSGNDTLMASGQGSDSTEMVGGGGSGSTVYYTTGGSVLILNSQSGDTLDLHNQTLSSVYAISSTVNGLTDVTLVTSGGLTQIDNCALTQVKNDETGGVTTSTIGQLIAQHTATDVSSETTLTATDNFVVLTGNADLSETLTNPNDGILVGNSGNDTLVTGGPGDTLVGGSGTDTLIAAGAGDILVGGSGNDTFVVSSYGTTIEELANNGNNTEEVSTDATLAANVQNLTGIGNAGMYLTGNGLNNVITANSGDDKLMSAGGQTTLIGGAGNDTFAGAGWPGGGGGATTYVVNSGDGNATILGGENGIVNYANNTIDNFSSSSDVLQFGAGITASDITATSTGSGSSQVYTLSVKGGSTVTIDDPAFYTVNFADGSSTTLAALAAQAQGTSTSSTSSAVMPTADTVLTLTGTANISGTGNGQADVIFANSGNDTLTAGSGLATLVGGSGNDTFVINNASDVIVEAANNGNNTEETSVSTSLTANVQNLIGTGSAALTLSSYTATSVIEANSGNDTLTDYSGPLGVQSTLIGGAGNDTMTDGTEGAGSKTTYVVNEGDGNITIANGSYASGSDVLSFGAGITQSSIVASISGIGSTMVETLSVAGGPTVTLDDPSFDNVTFADGSSTTLAALLATSSQQAASAATSAVSTVMAAGIIRLTLTGNANISGTGNNLADTITANSGNDTLIAGTGAATLIAGSGGDSLVAGSANDVMIAGSGSDTFVGGGGVMPLQATTYEINVGNGNVVINNSVSNDVLQFGSGISAANISVTSSGTGSSTVVTLSIGSETVTINNPGFATVNFSGGSSTTLAVLVQQGEQISSSTSIVLPAGKTELILTGTANISGTGNNLADTITANSGNDTLIAGSGLATLVGGGGNDTFVINNAADVINEATNSGNNTEKTSVSTTLAANVQNLIATGSAALTLTGNSQANVITGNTGQDTLIAGSGNETLVAGNTATIVGGFGNDTFAASGGVTMIGGSGNDTFVINNASDVITETTNSGNNTEKTSVSTILAANVQNLTGTGNAALTLTGNNLANVITGNAGADTLIAGLGNDTLIAGSGVTSMVGGPGNDTFVINNASDVISEAANSGNNVEETTVSTTLATNVEKLTATGSDALTLTGNSQNNVITGNSGKDTLVAGSGNDTLVAGSGITSMVGGTGNDTFVINNVSDVINEAANSGNNTEQSAVSTTLAANVQNLTGTGTAALMLTDNNQSGDAITANSGRDTLVSGTAADTLIGGSNNDTFVINNVADVIEEAANTGKNTEQASVSVTLAANVQNLTGIGSGNLTLTGNNLANVITANSGADTLVAGSGLATLVGGTGNDTFVIDNAADVITEAANTGNNVELTSVSATLAANVQNLTATGSTALTLTGNKIANTITANSGNDTLIAGSGIATLVGGAGDDTFVINNVSDVINETANSGNNTEETSVSTTLAANVKNLTGTGTAALTLTDNANQTGDVITANTGRDTLVSGSNADTLVGGTGSNTFVVNNSGDVITESASTTANVVQSTVNYVLPTNLLELTGIGSNAITLTGNTLADKITANSGDDTLVSGSGVAMLVAGAGNDTFVINNSSDAITAASVNAGNVVQSAVNYVLPTNLESLTGIGSNAITLTGNKSADIITANSGDDTLVAGSGVATLVGGTGNDVFDVNNASDVVTATSGSNVNTINSTVSYTASTNVQDLFGSGSAAITLTGNSGNDLIVGGTGTETLVGGTGASVLEAGSGTTSLNGSSASDALIAGSGKDALIAGSGNDFIAGGTGNDAITLGSGTSVVAFNSGDGKATIAAGMGTSNVLSLGGGIAYANLTFSKSGNNLILNTGGSNSITFTNWYAGATDQNFVNLQVIEQAASTYSASSTNALYNQDVEEFSFTQLVAAFNAALKANPSLTSWSLSNALLTDHLNGSNTTAFGGDLAYYDGMNENATGMNLGTAVSTLTNASYGKTAQNLDAWSGISNGSNKLH